MEASEMAKLFQDKLRETLAPVQERLQQMQTEIESLRSSEKPSPKSPDPRTAETAQVHHLCDNQACEPCVAQGQELVDGAYHQGQHDLLEQIDNWLLMAGGEGFRQQFVQLMAKGQQAYNESQQQVKVVA